MLNNNQGSIFEQHEVSGLVGEERQIGRQERLSLDLAARSWNLGGLHISQLFLFS